jgi:transcriptional regulator with GAF, ATPase, and Fis domain
MDHNFGRLSGIPYWFLPTDKHSKKTAYWRQQFAACGLHEHDFDFASAMPGVVLVETPGEQVFEQIKHYSSAGNRQIVVLLDAVESGFSTNDLWRLVDAGASDVIQAQECKHPVESIGARLHRWWEIDRILQAPIVKDNLVGNSPCWIHFLRQVVELARFTDSSALITGENGTGKELVARLIHSLDSKKDKKDLVVLDCTTVSPELAGSEFFGHEKGAFTNAVYARDGAFAMANGGTLFLDEVGELPPGLQAELLRVIQEQSFKRVGGNRWHQVDFRLVCATNRDLEYEQEQQNFRTDFYHRIASWHLQVPALNDRRDDIPVLVRHFLQQLYQDTEAPELTPAVSEYLMEQRYTGNGPITLGDIPDIDRLHRNREQFHASHLDIDTAVRSYLASGMDLKSIRNEIADKARILAIQDAQGNLQKAAERLGVTDRSLQ